jgi:peroxiredoxin
MATVGMSARKPSTSNPAQPANAGAVRFSLGEAINWLESAGVIEGALRDGEMVPDFELINATGHPLDLQRVLDRGPLVMVFTLGHASPLCRSLLCELQSRLEEISGFGASVVALTPDPPAVSCELSRKLGLGFDLLDDRIGRLAALFGIAYRPPMPTHEWLALFGLETPLEWPARDVPLPAAFVASPDGIVQMAFVCPDPRLRVTLDRLLAVLAALPGCPPLLPR